MIYKSKYLQIWLNPSWWVISIEIYKGLTIRIGRLVINLFGCRGLEF